MHGLPLRRLEEQQHCKKGYQGQPGYCPSPVSVLHVEAMFVDCLGLPALITGLVLIILNPGSRGVA